MVTVAAGTRPLKVRSSILLFWLGRLKAGPDTVVVLVIVQVIIVVVVVLVVLVSVVVLTIVLKLKCFLQDMVSVSVSLKHTTILYMTTRRSQSTA